jgi:DNA-binding GntR family transcriptional regulator
MTTTIGTDDAGADRASGSLPDGWPKLSKSAATSEGVHQALREAILSQFLEPGTRLAEEEVAGRFGISRTPVREAILRLEAEGLAERNSGRTAFVSELRPQEILEIYEVRAAIDGLAAELAATRIEPPALAGLEWTNQRMAVAGEAGDYATMASLNLEFHEQLARASGNAFLLQMLVAVHDRVRRFPGTTFSHGERWRLAIGEHEQILEALKAHDPTASGQRAKLHLHNARDVRIASLPEH